MAEEEQQNAPEFEPITPIKVSITSAQTEDSTRDAMAASDGGGRWLGIGFAMLVLILLAVFFLLPAVVETPQLAPEPAADISQKRANKPDTRSTPWQDAVAARSRKEAQEILTELLDKQFELEELGVSQWNAEGFKQGIDSVKQGDEHYRRQEFSASIEAYRRGLAQIDSLLESVDQVLTGALVKGAAAIMAGDEAAAKRAFDTALRIDPENESAKRGLERAKKLTAVVELLAQALTFEENQRWSEALAAYGDALALDPETEAAKAGVTKVDALIRAQDFATAMSAGLAYLGENQYDAARQSFQRALSLKPDAVEAQDGLDQAKQRTAQSKIRGFKKAADQFEAQERWQAALEQYESVLTLDASLVFAQEGTKRANARLRLDNLLEERIAQPERLAEEAVFRETARLLEVARGLSTAGPRLQGQVGRIEESMRKSTIPLPVIFESDNLTDITLYKVKRLGRFERVELSLKPGAYVAVGKRLGYRDVRKAFVINPDKQIEPIKIHCVERI